MITLPQRSKKKAAGKIGHLIYSIFLFIIISTFFVFELYSSGALDIDSANFYLTALLSLFFPFFAFSWMINKGISPKEMLKRLGLSRDRLSSKMIAIGIIIFFALFALEIMVNLVSSITNTTINTNVNLVLGSAPLWFFIFTSVIAPINEEIFFRGFLVPRIGIVVSAVIFGLLHASYNSTFGVEIIAAIIFGLIAGYVFKKSNSLYPSIVAHILLNTLAVLAFAVI